MSISQANIEWISRLSGISVDDISGALSNEEEVTLDFKLSGKVLSDEDQKRLREDGVQQGKQIASKQLASVLNLQLGEGEKDPELIASKFEKKLRLDLEKEYKTNDPTEAEKNAVKRAEEFEQKYLSVKNKNKELQETFEGLKTDYEKTSSELGSLKWSGKVKRLLPEKMSIDPEDAILITKNAIMTKKEDGVLKTFLNGQLQTDSDGDFETEENVIKKFIESKKWKIDDEGGMGGGDRKPKKPIGTKLTKEQMIEKVKAAGLAPASTEGIKMYQELQKENG